MIIASHKSHNAQRTTLPPTPKASTPKPQISYDAILIDDDNLIHSTWQAVARIYKKKIVFYKSPSEFYDNIENFDKNTPLYIDSNLGNGIKGEIVAKDIHDKGFNCIYLATGSTPDNFPQNMPWIKDIVSKDVPFLESRVKS